MPRSEFTTLVLRDNKVEVAGTLNEEAQQGAGFVHWLVEKDGVVGAGVVQADTSGFRDAETAPQPRWRAGEANAVGVHVQLERRADASVDVRSFVWTQRLLLTDA